MTGVGDMTAGAENVSTELSGRTGGLAGDRIRDAGEPHDGGAGRNGGAGHALVVAGEGSALISMIERAARDPNVDINKMERLFEMHERIERRRAEAAFNAAMAAAQAELKPVARKLQNTQTNSKYADLAAISDMADPIIHKHGLGVITSEFRSEMEGHLGVRCTVKHGGGHSESYDFNIPVDGAGIRGNANKTATHAYASTLTYGRRYAKCAVFDIATKNDVDGNATQRSGEPITDEQAEQIKQALEETGGLLPRFLAYWKLEKLTDLPAKQFDHAMASIRKSAQQRRRTQ